jgi:hypothetical protein
MRRSRKIPPTYCDYEGQDHLPKEVEVALDRGQSPFDGKYDAAEKIDSQEQMIRVVVEACSGRRHARSSLGLRCLFKACLATQSIP